MTNILFISSTEHLGGPAYSLLRLLDHLPASYRASVVLPEAAELAESLAARETPYYVQPLRLRRVPALAWLILRTRTDLVYANNYHYRSWLGLLAAKLVRRPFVWHIREMVRTETPVRHWLHRADAVVAVSQVCADCIREDVPAERLHIVHNGIEPEDFAHEQTAMRQRLRSELGLGPDAVVVVSLGHICERKNQLLAVELAADVVRSAPDTVFCLLGRLNHSPEYVAQVQQCSADLGLTDTVRLMGFRTDTPEFLTGADVFLHTSTIDPHPRSVIEAMAARLPVVAYATGGIPETVVAGETGLLAPLGDTAGLVAHLETLVADPAQRRAMGARGRERVEQQFTADRTAQQISTIIQRVLDQRK